MVRSPGRPASPAPPPAPALPAMDPVGPAMTYGAWMELGLARRQLLARMGASPAKRAPRKRATAR